MKTLLFETKIQNLSLTRILMGLLLLSVSISLLIIIARHALPFEDEWSFIAIDWRWIHVGLEGGGLNYGSGSAIRNPPWSLWLVRPLGLLSLRDSWAMLSLITLTILVISIPRVSKHSPLFWLSIVLLITSFPAIRNIVDGNFESLIIGGVLLLLHANQHQKPIYLAIGALLVTAKPQEIWLLIPVLTFVILKTWSTCKWIVAGVVVLLIVGLSTPWLSSWWHAFIEMRQHHSGSGSILDISLAAALSRLGAPHLIILLAWGVLFFGTVWVTWQNWRSSQLIHRQQAGFLMAASMLLSPYTAGNSLLTILAIGIIPLFQQSPLLGGLLIILTNIMYFVGTDFRYWYQAYYWTLWLILVWGVLWFKLHQLNQYSGAGLSYH